ncbi:MAG: DNA-binding protein [Nitrososphaerota archaeon]|nr:DNA-binding protein [Nitrososphaerota archaeon]
MYEDRDNQPKAEAQEDKEKKALRENIMRMALTSEARQRLANIRMVKPQIAQAIEEYIVQLASSGKLKQVVNDDQLKEILGSMQGKKREFTIKRI